MSLYSEFYLNSNPSIAELDMLEIQHFRFNPTVFRLTRNGNIQDITGTDAFGNPRRGCIVTHEGGAGPFEYEYVPLKIDRLGSGTDMDQSIRVTLGDVGTILAQQLERIDLFNANTIKPIVRYRAYSSNSLTVPLTVTPVVLEMKRVVFNREGASFEAISPYLNVGKTGIVYTTKDFPTMKAFFRNR